MPSAPGAGRSPAVTSPGACTSAQERDEHAFADGFMNMLQARPGALAKTAVAYTRLCFEPLWHRPYRITRPYVVSIVERTLVSRAPVDAELAALSASFDERDQALLREIVFGTLRWLKRLDQVLVAASGRTFEQIQPALLPVLRVAAYQLLFLDRVPAHAIVSEAVDEALRRSHKGAGGFVNAVLRRVELADKATLFAAPRHPYTRMLLDAIPDIAMSGRNRTPVQGEVPNPLSPPTGCSFHPRCPHANERSKRERPPLLSSAAGWRSTASLRRGRSWKPTTGRSRCISSRSRRRAGVTSSQLPSSRRGSRPSRAGFPGRD